MKTFFAAILAAAAMAIKIQEDTAGGSGATTDAPAAAAPAMEPQDWWPAGEDLYKCIDSHGDKDGKVQARELVEAFENLHDAGVIDDDLKETLEKKEEELGIKPEDVISHEFAAVIVEFILDHENVPHEERAASVKSVADLCKKAHDGPEEPKDWWPAGEDLYKCIDQHGDKDGKVQARELFEAFENLHEVGVLDADLKKTLHKIAEHEGVEEGDVIDHKTAAGIVEFILDDQKVPEIERAASVKSVADLCEKALPTGPDAGSADTTA